MKKINIAILKGGISSEREISLISGSKVAKNIPRNKYNIYIFDTKKDLFKLINAIKNKKIDIVFPVLHGKYGEDGCIQGLLETLQIPYVGPNVFTSSLCMNKEKTKRIASSFNIKTPKFKMFKKGEVINLKKIKLPCVVKPVDAGSSVGITIPETKKELIKGIKNAFKESSLIMIEEFIKGREFTVGVIGNKKKIIALPVTEIIPLVSKFYDYKAKYQDGGSKHICPAKIPGKLTNKMQSIAKQMFEAVEARGMSRIDFMVSHKKNEIYFIEVNTIPGMTNVSLLPEAAKAAGINFSKFLDLLIQYSIK